MNGTAASDGNSPALAVLRQFGFSPFAIDCAEVPAGFSGATVWKVTSRDAPSTGFALKRWPPGQPAYTPLTTIHQWMQTASSNGMRNVPCIHPTASGATVVEHNNLWDLVTWMPGKPVNDPSDLQLEQAIRQLDMLHSNWRGLQSTSKAPCPAVLLQYQRLSAWKDDDWDRLQRNPLPLCQQSVYLLKRLIPEALLKLSPWLTRKVVLQPCLADIWADHVLFQNDMVTGIIDFGGARIDHPAQDLARLISAYSLTTSRSLLDCFDRYHDRSETCQSLARLLAHTGLVVSLSNWLRWLFLERRQFANPMNCMQRIEQIYVRLCDHSDNLLG